MHWCVVSCLNGCIARLQEKKRASISTGTGRNAALDVNATKLDLAILDFVHAAGANVVGVGTETVNPATLFSGL